MRLRVCAATRIPKVQVARIVGNREKLHSGMICSFSHAQGEQENHSASAAPSRLRLPRPRVCALRRCARRPPPRRIARTKSHAMRMAGALDSYNIQAS